MTQTLMPHLGPMWNIGDQHIAGELWQWQTPSVENAPLYMDGESGLCLSCAIKMTYNALIFIPITLTRELGQTSLDPHVCTLKVKAHFLDHVCGCMDCDKSVVCALKELSLEVNLWGNEWEECDGLVLFRGKVYVPLDGQLQHDIVEAHYNTPVTGHSGWWKMTKLVARNYWWPGIGHYIAKYVKECDLCNCTKMFPTAPLGKLMPSHAPDHWWQVISVNLITEPPWSHGYDALLVVVAL